LGNVRLVFTESNGLASIVQENHYYPFGMQQNGNWAKSQTVKNDYLYNGKELNTDLGLNWSDYGFRNYDAAIGRFTGVDPISDQFPHLSTYNYAGNSPIANIDLWGLQPLFAADGTLIQYNVQEGQGPTQIAQDLNENYDCYLNCEVDYTDIVQDNSEQFSNALNEDGTPKDKSDDSYKSGNVTPDSILEITDGTDQVIENNIDKIAENKNSIDSIKEVMVNDDRETFKKLTSPAMKPQPGDPGGGFEFVKIIENIKLGVRRNGQNNEIENLIQKNDSLKSVNDKRANP